MSITNSPENRMTEQGTRTMRTLNIPPLTPAQRAINELVTGGTEFSLTEKAIYNRVTEVASDVRALAATVEELKGRMDEFIGQVYVDLTERIEALEPVCYDDHGSTVPCAEAPPIKVDWRESPEYQRDRAEADADDLEQIRSRVLPQSPETLNPFTVRVTPESGLIAPGSAEAAPGSSCRECGHLRSEHFEMRWPEDPNHCLVEGCKCDYFCHQHVSPEPSFTVPPPGPENMVQRGGNPWRGRTTVEPSRRAAVDTDSVMAAVKEYGDARLRYRSAREKYPLLVERAKSDAESSLAAIRAMLEPHDAARLRERHGEAWSAVRKLLNRYDGNTNDGIAIADGVASAAVDAVIRAIGGER